MSAEDPDPEPYDYDYQASADYIGCSKRQVERWVRSGQMPHVKMGLFVRFSRAQLDAFIASRTYTPPGMQVSP